ncbi:MAG: DUF2235 domain-containing protein [Pseudomonadota bacterium]
MRGTSLWESPAARPTRGRVDHVIIIDGSLSTLAEGRETNAGQLYKLLCEVAPQRNISLWYEQGIQFPTWAHLRDIIEGRGINRQIRRVYGFIASRYRPGDRIFLFGYSRGAYAVRSLAGVIERVGLVRPDYATVRHILIAYRHYERGGDSPIAQKFRRLYCHDETEIEMIGVWDTVKALGIRLPFLSHLTETKHRFHTHTLGPHIRHAFHALALDETRKAFAPVLWDTTQGHPGQVEQMWFRGSHGDVGGQLSGYTRARPLANIPFTWMVEKAEHCGLSLPTDWRQRFPCDARAPSVGNWRSWGPIFLSRAHRTIGMDPSERIHSSVPLTHPALDLSKGRFDTGALHSAAGGITQSD